MLDYQNKINQCTICRHEHTSMHAEAMPGVKIYICINCLEAAKYNFIWICLNCWKVHIRSKSLIGGNIHNKELRRAYILCEDMQIIQGINICIECDPEGVFNYVHPAAREC